MTNRTPEQPSTERPTSKLPVGDHPAPEKVYENLENLGEVDVAQGATYRKDAVDVLADADVSVEMRTAIADRLGQEDHLLSLKNVDPEESY